MNKKLMLSAIAIGLISSANVNAAENLSTMFSEGKVSGQVRMFYLDREYQGTAGNTTHRNAYAVGGNLKFETAEFNGLSLGTAFYTTNRIKWLDYNNGSEPAKTDSTLFGPNDKGYNILGEAYVQYKRGNTTFKGGRQKFNSPLLGTDDARMIPNLVEGYVLTNKDIKDTTVIAGHITKFAQGTFGNVYSGVNAPNQILSVTSGYSVVDPDGQVGSFVDMGKYATGKSTDGVSVVGAKYKGIENLTVQLWDYYAHDILNAIYGQVDFKWSCLLSDSIKPFASVQVIKENSVGDEVLSNSSLLGGNGEIDSLYWAAKVGAKVGAFTAYVAYSKTTDNDTGDASYKNAIVTPWGGMPAFTQGMVTRHQFLAGTEATKVAGTYSFKELGVNGSLSAYYASFDMDANSGYGVSRTATESGFDVIYYPEMVKKLQLRFRGNFPRDFYEGGTGATGWSEYRVIANYNF